VPMDFLKKYKWETNDHQIIEVVNLFIKTGEILVKNDLLYTANSKYISLIESS